MLKLGKQFKLVIYNIYRALFKSDFYQEVVSYKISSVLISFFMVLLLAYSLPLLNVLSKFASIDLVNPENRISKEIEGFIQQVPDFSIEAGKITIANEEVIQIYDYQKENILVEFSQTAVSQKEGAVFFGEEGVFIQEYAIKDYLLNLFDLPHNTVMSQNQKFQYDYLAYSEFDDIEVSSSIIRSAIINMVQTYGIKSYVLMFLYFVTANFLLLIAQIIVFSFFAITIVGKNKLKYRDIFILTASAFIPHLILETINILTYKQSYLLNSSPYSFIIFVVVNGYFVRFAVLSFLGKNK
ncbi:MAG: DUF1189 family protein [Rickettsiales bacterium]|jgi:hypothetical protein|nr:DUF1189 family protein [Rickettsiales bacterium]